jgi:hypothetical protein
MQIAILASSFENDTALVTFITGPFVALLVGLVTKSTASAGLKAVVNLLLSAVAGVIAQYATNTASETVRDYVIAVFITWVTSISAYEGFWKKTNVSGAISAATSDFGLGSPPVLEVEAPVEPNPDSKATSVGGNTWTGPGSAS